MSVMIGHIIPIEMVCGMSLHFLEQQTSPKDSRVSVPRFHEQVSVMSVGGELPVLQLQPVSEWEGRETWGLL